MKKTLLVLCLLGVNGISNAQNTFPTPSGDVGIGTASPNTIAEIKRTFASGATGTDFLRLTASQPGAWFSQVGLQFRWEDTGNNAFFNLAQITATPQWPAGIQSGGELQFWTKTLNTSATSELSEKMRITEAGNIGIGTISPAAKLDIKTNSSQLMGLSISPEGNHHSYLMINRKEGYDGGILWNKDGSSAWQQINSDNGSMSWYSYGKIGGGATVLTFSKEGDIGIGTTTPAEKLSVNGKIRAHEVKVEVTGWPDYVFENSYKLEKLETLERFINDNKHLPDIPSAVEVAKDGINLGVMDAKLLKKIEELTLYIIELKREVDQLKKYTYEN